MGYQVGDYWRRWSALGEFIIVAGNLSDDRRDIGMKVEFIVVNKKTSHATKVKRGEEIFDV